MNDPYQLLGITPAATPEEIRHAYHLAAKKDHPDKYQDPQQQKAAQHRMALLNQAYEQALHTATQRERSPYHQQLPWPDAMKLCVKMMDQDYPQGALRELLRSDSKPPMWYYLQGKALLAMEQYETAIRSFRAAVRLEPMNNTFRAGALEAELALKRSQTLQGRIRKGLKQLLHRE